MKEYEIWMEGAIIQGGRFEHQFVGRSYGETFRDAVVNWYKEHPSSTFDEKYLCDWGCGLYPTEEEAMQFYIKAYPNKKILTLKERSVGHS